MKNLILTFVFALVTLITFSQSKAIVFDYQNTTRDNDTVIAVEYYAGPHVTYWDSIPDTIYTIIVSKNDTITFSTIDNNEYIIGATSDGLTLVYDTRPYSQLITFTDFTEFIDSIFYIHTQIGNDHYVVRIVTQDIPQGTASINDIKAENIELNVYPNPVQDIATVTFTSTQALPVELYSLSGQLILTETNTMVGTNNVQLNMSDLPQGMYLVKVGSTTFRTIKK